MAVDYEPYRLKIFKFRDEMFKRVGELHRAHTCSRLACGDEEEARVYARHKAEIKRVFAGYLTALETDLTGRFANAEKELADPGTKAARKEDLKGEMASIKERLGDISRQLRPGDE